MFDSNKHKFSNPLSTYRQSTSKAHHSRSPITQRRFNNKNVFNKNISPTNKQKKNYTCIINSLNTYKESDKIKFTEQKMKKITHTLNIEAATQRNYLKRLADKQLYLDYNFNPFLVDDKDNDKKVKKRENVENRLKKNQKQTHVKNMIHQVSSLNNKQQIGKRMYENNIIDQTGVREILKTQEFKLNKSKKKTIIQKNKAHQEEGTLNIQQSFSADPFIEFDNIIKIKQNNFNENIVKLQNFNLFKVFLDENDKSLMNSKQILKKYNFCDEPMDVKSKQAKTINVFKYLSNNSRMIHFKMGTMVPSSFKINQQSVVIDTQMIQFDGIMMVSNGVLQPEMMKYFFSNSQNKTKVRDQQKQSSLAGQQQIFYADNHQHKGTIRYGQDYEVQQNNYYIDQTFTVQQKKHKDISTFYKNKLQKFLKIQQHLNSHFIGDLTLKSKINEYKQTLLETQLNNLYDHVYTEKQRDLDRIIRYNKVNKNRFHRIKINMTQESLKLKKMYQEKAKLIKKDKSGRSPRNQYSMEKMQQMLKFKF